MGSIVGFGHREDLVSMRFKIWEKIISTVPEVNYKQAESFVNCWFNWKVYGCTYDNDVIESMCLFEKEILEEEQSVAAQGAIVIDIQSLLLN